MEGLQSSPPKAFKACNYWKPANLGHYPDYNKIVAAVKALATDPRPHGYKKLKGRPGYRIRVGDYRIIYQVKDNILTVFVLIIGNRRDVYE